MSVLSSLKRARLVSASSSLNEMMLFLVLTYDERNEILSSELGISLDKNAVEICQIKYDILTVFGFSERKWIDEVSVLLLIQRAVIIQLTVVRALDI